jgi:hypothetical protein
MSPSNSTYLGNFHSVNFMQHSDIISMAYICTMFVPVGLSLIKIKGRPLGQWPDSRAYGGFASSFGE